MHVVQAIGNLINNEHDVLLWRGKVSASCKRRTERTFKFEVAIDERGQVAVLRGVGVKRVKCNSYHCFCHDINVAGLGDEDVDQLDEVGVLELKSVSQVRGECSARQKSSTCLLEQSYLAIDLLRMIAILKDSAAMQLLDGHLNESKPAARQDKSHPSDLV
jgi:hypothetical protein